MFFYLDILFQLKIYTMALLRSIQLHFPCYKIKNSKYSNSKNIAWLGTLNIWALTGLLVNAKKVEKIYQGKLSKTEEKVACVLKTWCSKISSLSFTPCGV